MPEIFTLGTLTVHEGDGLSVRFEPTTDAKRAFGEDIAMHFDVLLEAAAVMTAAYRRCVDEGEPIGAVSSAPYNVAGGLMQGQKHLPALRGKRG